MPAATGGGASGFKLGTAFLAVVLQGRLATLYIRNKLRKKTMFRVLIIKPYLNIRADLVRGKLRTNDRDGVREFSFRPNISLKVSLAARMIETEEPEIVSLNPVFFVRADKIILPRK